MQTVIYADVLFILNAVITFLMLNLTSDLIKTDAVPKRIISGSLVGGIYSFILFAPEMKLLLSLTIKAIMLLSIVLISFTFVSIKKLFRCISIFILISFIFSGLMYFAAVSMFNNNAYINNGYVYFDFGPFGVIGLITACYIIIKILNRTVFAKKNKDLILNVVISNQNNSIRIKALYDSGNTVSDPFTGKPVIIINISQVSSLIDNIKYKELFNFVSDKNIESIPDGFRLLPIRALGHLELIPAFTVDKAILFDDGKEISIIKPSLAITADSFDNKYSALINESVLKGDINGFF